MGEGRRGEKVGGGKGRVSYELVTNLIRTFSPSAPKNKVVEKYRLTHLPPPPASFSPFQIRHFFYSLPCLPSHPLSPFPFFAPLYRRPFWSILLVTARKVLSTSPTTHRQAGGLLSCRSPSCTRYYLEVNQSSVRNQSKSKQK
jgi:hypothetical protein